ncbi:hypothetical protein [Companilactobacillus hulinensis]|uniref:hypothetical protein n=1 Tax=Companilactobacillus hulinensis TaxID=2486007 RepID=UPI0013DDE72D|nr:hypothetical protein [Companilactobacillus hulinensis]
MDLTMIVVALVCTVAVALAILLFLMSYRNYRKKGYSCWKSIGITLILAILPFFVLMWGLI